MDKLKNILKSVGALIVGSVATYILSTDGVTAIQAALPHTPVGFIISGLSGVILHSLGTSWQALSVAMQKEEI